MIMTQQTFEEYENGFNSSPDKSTFFDRWYHPDAEFLHPIKGAFRGKDQIVGFWNCGKYSGHAGIHEALRLRNFLSIEGKMAVELDIEWTCFEDTDYLGARKKGDVFYGRCAAFYTFSGDKIRKVQIYLNCV